MGLEFYFFAFKDLNTCRSAGFGLGPIPWIAVNDYAIRHGLNNEEAEDLFFVIDSLDYEYMKWRATKDSKD